ncbi:MAG TPA: sugar phosphate isomerase/epimerase family protein [Pirellulales bacterium]
METWPIGVFTSLDAGLGVKLEVAQELDVPTIHLHAPAPKSRTPEQALAFLKKLKAAGIRITVVFGGFEGESYADIPTVERTVGLVPRKTRVARVREMKEISDFTTMLACDAVGLHLGFVPHDPADPLYSEALDLTRDLCDHCRQNGQGLHLETGQETAETLARFITDVERPNLFINFDPANMILYGAGEPIAALEVVGRWVRSVHCKGATWAKSPGKEWGVETPLGAGAVGFDKFLRALKKIGYLGPLTIEREIPQDPTRQKAEIGHAVTLLTKLKAEIL